jgi:hypothetical protein
MLLEGRREDDDNSPAPSRWNELKETLQLDGKHSTTEQQRVNQLGWRGDQTHREPCVAEKPTDANLDP